MFHSQYGQDTFLHTHIFKTYSNGVFVDVGAHDGITLNNTLYFEQHHNWSGINIEPLDHVYKKLTENRPKMINLNCAISETPGTAMFISNTGYTEMLSGLLNTFHPKHLERLCRENKDMGSTSELKEVTTRRLDDIFQEYNVNRVNYLSIDVEGAEHDVVRSIDFEQVFIDVIGYENNYNDTSVQAYLESKGYRVISHPDLVHSLDIFMIHLDSEFITKNDFNI